MKITAYIRNSCLYKKVKEILIGNIIKNLIGLDDYSVIITMSFMLFVIFDNVRRAIFSNIFFIKYDTIAYFNVIFYICLLILLIRNFKLKTYNKTIFALVMIIQALCAVNYFINGTSILNIFKTEVFMILPIFILCCNIDITVFPKVFDKFLSILNGMVIVLVILGVIDFITHRGVQHFLNFIHYFDLMYSIEVRQPAAIYRYLSFLGHPLRNTQLFLTFFILNSLNNRYLKPKINSYFLSVILLVGVGLSNSKTGIILGIFLILINSFKDFKKSSPINFIIPIVIILIFINTNYFRTTILQRFVTNDLTSGRNDAFQYIKNALIPYPTLFGKGAGYSGILLERINSRLSSFEYPFMIWVYDFGLIFTILIYIVLGGYQSIKLVLSRNYYILIMFLFLVLDVNTYNGVTVNGDFMAQYCFIIFMIMHLSRYVNSKKYIEQTTIRNNERTTEKKRILIVIDNLLGGGAEKVLISLLNNWNYDKYDVDLLLLTYEGVYIDKIPTQVKVNYIFNLKGTSFNNILNKIVRKVLFYYISFFDARFIYKHIIRNKYDSEIAFMEGISTKIVAASSNNSTKIAWMHTDPSDYHWYKKYYRNLNQEKEVYKKFDKIVCVSKDAKGGFKKLYGDLKNKLIVIYNAIDINEIMENSEQFNVTYEEVTVCAVGSLEKQKGFDRLITIHSKLIKQGINHNLIIIGEGSKRNELELLIKKLGVDKSVNLIGFKVNPYPYIKASDILVCSSYSEGFSLVIAEAIILGKAIVSTKCSGPIELLGNGNFGMLVENSINGLYEGLNQLLTYEQKRKELEDKVTERIRFFDINSIITKIEKLIE